MISPSKEQLLSSIQPGMKLDKSFFLRIYGYEISFPGFREEAISKLERAGCSRAMEYYDQTVSEYQVKHDAELRPVARWYRQQLEAEFKEDMKKYDRTAGEQERNQQISNLKKNRWNVLSEILNFQ